MADSVQMPALDTWAQNRSVSSDKRHEALESACRDFESVFVQYMMKEMRRTVPESGLTGGGHAEKMYTSMLDSEVAKAVSMQRGIGLASVLYDQLSGCPSLGKKGPVQK
jgi:flagellar protein FlgJ